MRCRDASIRSRACGVLAAVLAIFVTPAWVVRGQEPPDLPSVSANLPAARWVSRDEGVELRLSRAVPAGRLAIVIDKTDWTSLFELTGTRLVYRPGLVPLPAGTHDLIVYHVSPSNEWHELARFPLRVLTAGRFESAEAAPALDLSGKGQVAAGYAPDGNAPPRDRFQDVTLNLGGRFSVARHGWNTSGQLALLGVTHRADALQFASQASSAPLLDLSNYLLGARNDSLSFSVGHVTFGNQRHLAAGFGSRGAMATMRLGARADVTLAGLNGSSIVGWSNFLGLQNRHHRVFAGTFGLEALPSRPGALRLELTGLNGSILPQFGVNERRVNDAEESSGAGLRLVATDPRNRLIVDAGYSRSHFGNPSDRLLSQQVTVVPVRDETREARYADISYAVVQSTAGPRPFNVRVGVKHERVEPLFRSVIGGVAADVDQNAGELSVTYGEAAAQLTYSRAHDNLDGIESILRTNTRVLGLMTSAPLADAGRRWRPAVTYQLNRTHQAGDGLPVNSDFVAQSQVPDQLSTNHVLGFELQHALFRAAYQFNRSFQDNRQPGRALSDLLNLTNNVSLGVQPNAAFDFTVDVAFEGAENREFTVTDVTRRAGVAATWRPLSRTVVTGNLTVTMLRDDRRTRDNRATDLNLQLARAIPLWKSAGDRPQGQLFVRYSRQSARLFEAVFGTRDDRHLWTMNTGFSVSLF